ncbi:MAG: branched-chain amino acid aminotransferase [Planctomycetota bacterium]
MLQISRTFLNDEAGFIVSAELVLIATIGVLSLIVGLSEVAFGVNQELEDIGSAFGAMNQSYAYNGVAGHKGSAAGSAYGDTRDYCDGDADIVCNVYPTGEAPAWNQ